MKQLIMAVALIAGSFASVFAGNTTKTQNDAAIKAGRKQLAAKVILLENSQKTHNGPVTNSTALEIRDLMMKAMDQARTDINYQTGEQQKAAIAKFNKMEMSIYEYTKLASDPKTNASQLVERSRAFMTQY